MREKVISGVMARKDNRDELISQLEKEVVRLKKDVARLHVHAQRLKNSDVAIQTTSREEPITLPVSDMTLAE